ncbi:hypothetical protein ABLO26_26550 [Neobacillus sp. 179-J 1A1 HS]
MGQKDELFPSNRRPTIAVTVLGDMKGLGVITQEAHKEVGSYAALNKVDYLYTTGELAMMISQAALEQGMSPDNVIHFERLIRKPIIEWPIRKRSSTSLMC